MGAYRLRRGGARRSPYSAQLWKPVGDVGAGATNRNTYLWRVTVLRDMIAMIGIPACATGAGKNSHGQETATEKGVMNIWR